MWVIACGAGRLLTCSNLDTKQRTDGPQNIVFVLLGCIYYALRLEPDAGKVNKTANHGTLHARLAKL